MALRHVVRSDAALRVTLGGLVDLRVDAAGAFDVVVVEQPMPAPGAHVWKIWKIWKILKVWKILKSENS